MGGVNALSYSRTAAVTANVLKEYKEMIENTTSDLEDHLQEIDDKLQALTSQGATISREEAADIQKIREERDSTQQCLGICAQVSAHVDKIRANALENISTPPDANYISVTTLQDTISARLVTSNTLQDCKDKLKETTSELEKHLQDINNRLQNLSSQQSRATNEPTAAQEQIKEELASIKQCLAICDEASKKAEKHRINVFEDVLSNDDAYQVVVATLGDLISAKRVTTGARSKQWLGQMSDASLQQLSRDNTNAAIEAFREPQSEGGAQFENRHGTGYKLNSGSLRGKGVPPP